jgi:hypothetical protein
MAPDVRLEVRRCASQLRRLEKLARLGALESELFVDDSRFKDRAKLRPDPAKKALFTHEVARAERLADAALQKSQIDPNALFVKSLTFGLRADNADLIDKQSFAALGYTKEGRVFAERLMRTDPRAANAYLGPGVENYPLSLKPAPVRVLLWVTGSNVEREKGLEELRETSSHGHYLEPLAKLLLAVAALRDNDRAGARELLAGLHRRFPDNEFYGCRGSRSSWLRPQPLQRVDVRAVADCFSCGGYTRG